MSALICFFIDCRIIFYSVSPTFRFKLMLMYLCEDDLLIFTKGEYNGIFNLHNYLSGLLNHFSYIHFYRKRIMVCILCHYIFYGGLYVCNF